jgi:sterol desaturase/sphingolipid hydroxylase (fatty acid hydroxylase superfamily)
MTPIYTATAIGVLFLVLFVLERGFPLRRPKRTVLRRVAVNLCVSALALGTGFALVKPAATAAMHDAQSWRFGLLQWVELPPAIALVTGILLLDLAFYFWHLANHRVAGLWRFHVVHHIDPDLDVTTAFRFHFGEVALSAGFRIVQILTIGASPTMIAIYELMFHASTLFQHSNLRLPIGVERVVNLVLVTPRMHGIHHSTVMHETTSNFSVVFSWWDRLRRTLVLNVPQQQVEIGLPAYPTDADNAPGALLLLPFRRQPDAWQRPDGARVTRDKAAGAPLTVLAE